MMNKTSLLSLSIILLAGAFVASPAKARPKKNYAETAVSESFSREFKKKVAILPFMNDGKEGVDHSVADKLGLKLMQLGFVVVERSQLEKIFQELKLNYSGSISGEELKKIGKILSVDMVVFGTNNFQYVPGRDSHRKKLVSQSVRFVDVQSGEVLISSYCCDVKTPQSQIIYIIESLGENLSPK